jgi:AraC-like DNA-binding protein
VPYVEIAPSAALRPWVECFWTRNDDAPSGEHRILPDGCADLVFDLRGGESVVVGTMTKPLFLPEGERSDFVGVRFRPGRAAAFLRMPLAEITDARVPLGMIWKGWSDGILERRVELLAMLETELLRRLDPDRDRRVDAAVEQIVTNGGNVRIDTLAREIGISRQHLARQFLHHVGVSPKTFARVMRFRALTDNLHGSDVGWADVDWAGKALEHGFYDQSHLIGDFRELAGTTPDAFHFSNR